MFALEDLAWLNFRWLGVLRLDLRDRLPEAAAGIPVRLCPGVLMLDLRDKSPWPKAATTGDLSSPAAPLDIKRVCLLGEALLNEDFRGIT